MNISKPVLTVLIIAIALMVAGCAETRPMPRCTDGFVPINADTVVLP